jgi:hypothetical protein
MNADTLIKQRLMESGLSLGHLPCVGCGAKVVTDGMSNQDDHGNPLKGFILCDNCDSDFVAHQNKTDGGRGAAAADQSLHGQVQDFLQTSRQHVMRKG